MSIARSPLKCLTALGMLGIALFQECIRGRLRRVFRVGPLRSSSRFFQTRGRIHFFEPSIRRRPNPLGSLLSLITGRVRLGGWECRRC